MILVLFLRSYLVNDEEKGEARLPKKMAFHHTHHTTPQRGHFIEK